ncbi:MAG: AAA family ATPase [Sulfurimonas sp.]|nr:AAA family ATPase [Sulfurimonas sp.]MDD3059368.1 AAA family ATPase [Sulfurimonas sp.]MDD5201730.1 AAA family ATPase [Sulfurimonas sp.]
MLTDFFAQTQEFIRLNDLSYKRYFFHLHSLEHRLSIILGPRGIGKTTVIAQYIHHYYKNNEALYVSMDNIKNIHKFSMLEIAQEFNLNNGKLLCFDEIHKYENWSAELKAIYDTYPDLKVIATGSSALEINKGTHDLSRRAIVYHMKGMSFREYLELSHGYELPAYSLEEILSKHIDISIKIRDILSAQEQKVIPLFKEYLEYGYYPYFNSMPNKTMFFATLEQNINVSIESDLLNIYPKLNGVSIRKIKLLLAVIMQSVPFTPKLADLKNAIEVKDDRTLKEYLCKLDDAGLIKLLMKSSLSMKALDKPEKIYLANTNLMQLASPNIGNIRETFFMNQLDNYYNNKNSFLKVGIYASDKGDFYLEEKYTFEVGGKNKDFKQIKDIPNSYIAADDIEFGFGNKIPLWLFGFLY